MNRQTKFKSELLKADPIATLQEVERTSDYNELDLSI